LPHPTEEHCQDLVVGRLLLLHPGWLAAVCSVLEYMTEHPMNGHLTSAGIACSQGIGVNRLNDAVGLHFVACWAKYSYK